MKYTLKHVMQSTKNLLLEVTEVRSYRERMNDYPNYLTVRDYNLSLKDLCIAFGMIPNFKNLELISKTLEIDNENLDRKLLLLNELDNHSFLIGSKIDIGIISLATLERLYEIMTRTSDITIDEKSVIVPIYPQIEDTKEEVQINVKN